MGLKKTFSYKTKLFFIINVFFWMLVFVFVTIQYSREREFKIELLDARLQAYNSILINEYEETGALDVASIHRLIPDKELRVTLLDKDGNVLLESHHAMPLGNHRTRPEIAAALEHGRGYTIRRLSEVDNREYFYSATAGNDVVMRSALPYDVSLLNVLQGDMAYIWIILGVTAIINIILYFAISRFSLGVKVLKDIASRAKSDDILSYDVSDLPDDELGEVSLAILNIYKELKETAKERDASIEDALFEEKEKMRIKHQLTSNINHELKTPVQAIRGCLETLIENDDLDRATAKKLLETGYSNTMRLTNLLQDVALITQMTDAKATLDVQKVNVGEVIATIKEEVSLYSPENKMRINVDVPDGVEIVGNKRLVDAIFRNLVNNSIAYSGGRDVFIKMEKETDDAYWFDVYDNGSGVEEKHLSRIFERFYRIDSGRSRKSGGTGLGLSIVRNAVQFHGGEIKARNRQYAGLEFIFSLCKNEK